MAKQLVFLYFFLSFVVFLYGDDRYDTHTAVIYGMDTETIRCVQADQLEIWTKSKPVSA